MNMQKGHAESTRLSYSPFGVCLMVFVMLGVDSGFRLAKVFAQRRQIGQAQVVQAQNVGRLSRTVSQQPQVEARLQALSIDLVQIAKTNTTARQIVQEFNIQWTPGPTPAATPPAK